MTSFPTPQAMKESFTDIKNLESDLDSFISVEKFVESEIKKKKEKGKFLEMINLRNKLSRLKEMYSYSISVLLFGEFQSKLLKISESHGIKKNEELNTLQRQNENLEKKQLDKLVVLKNKYLEMIKKKKKNVISKLKKNQSRDKSIHVRTLKQIYKHLSVSDENFKKKKLKKNGEKGKKKKNKKRINLQDEKMSCDNALRKSYVSQRIKSLENEEQRKHFEKVKRITQIRVREYVEKYIEKKKKIFQEIQKGRKKNYTEYLEKISELRSQKIKEITYNENWLEEKSLIADKYFGSVIKIINNMKNTVSSQKKKKKKKKKNREKIAFESHLKRFEIYLDEINNYEETI